MRVLAVVDVRCGPRPTRPGRPDPDTTSVVRSSLRLVCPTLLILIGLVSVAGGSLRWTASIPSTAIVAPVASRIAEPGATPTTTTSPGVPGRAARSPTGWRLSAASLDRTATSGSSPEFASLVAAEDAGGTVFRYVSEGEANVAGVSGRVPNVDRLGNPKNVFYSPDRYASAAEAENALQIGRFNPTGATAGPTHVIAASSRGADWAYGGNVEGGSGVELITENPLDVLGIWRLGP